MKILKLIGFTLGGGLLGLLASGVLFLPSGNAFGAAVAFPWVLVTALIGAILGKQFNKESSSKKILWGISIILALILIFITYQKFAISRVAEQAESLRGYYNSQLSGEKQISGSYVGILQHSDGKEDIYGYHTTHTIIGSNLQGYAVRANNQAVLNDLKNAEGKKVRIYGNTKTYQQKYGWFDVLEAEKVEILSN